MLCIITVGEVKTSYVHSIFSQFQHNVLVICVGAHSADDLSFLHVFKFLHK